MRARYVEAAKKFRLPFWDPLLVRYVPDAGNDGPWHCGIPKVLGAGEVRVRKPTSPHLLSNIPNPLYCYKFSSEYKYDNNLPFNWAKFWNNRPSSKLKVTPNKMTNRGPDLDGKPNNRRVTQNSSRDRNTRKGVATWLTQQGSRMQLMFFAPRPATATPEQAYGLFATSAYGTDARTGDPINRFIGYSPSSIETFHGAVHGVIGRGEQSVAVRSLVGHMGEVPYSSFDPIFWLHHWYAHSFFPSREAEGQSDFFGQ